MPKFNKGDRVRVRLASHSPYKGQIGVVDDNPSSYSSSSGSSSGIWYMVRFEWRGLHPAARFMEEDLEAATDEINPEETPDTAKFAGRSRLTVGNKIIQVLNTRKYLLIIITVVLIIAAVLVALNLVASNNKETKIISPTPFTTSPIPTTTGVAAGLEFTTQPDGGTAGLPFSTQPIVAVIDAEGQTVTDYSAPVSLVIYNQTNNKAATLSGTKTVSAVNGIATFKDISTDLAGSDYMLTAISGNLKSAISSIFAVAPSAPKMLIFITEPVGDGAGTWFSTQPVVAIEDAYGNVVTDSTNEVTVNITPDSGTSGAILSGGTTVKATNGVAIFAYLKIDLIGSEYKLTATSPGLKSTQSEEFYITKATTTQ